MKRLLRLVLLLIALGLGALAWDVRQLRGLRPPDDRSFEGFVRAGRERSGLQIDETGGRLYWVSPPARTILPAAEPPVYAFDRKGALVDWTPGREPGMLTGAPLLPRGRSIDLAAARAWLLLTK